MVTSWYCKLGILMNKRIVIFTFLMHFLFFKCYLKRVHYKNVITHG